MKHFHICRGLPVLFLVLFFISCGDTEDPLDPDPNTANTATYTLGTLKITDADAPGAPSAPGAGVPFVKEVGYYSDWKLTKPLSGTVQPGTTFFVKVVFSEPMKFKAADDNSARPILYHRHGRQRFRFRIAEHGAGGENFVHGDAKPFGGGTDDYVCKYTVPADATGKFRIEIGKFNADLEGNNLPAFYTHEEQLQFGQSAEPATSGEADQPTVKEVGYYSDWKLTTPITGTVSAGTTVYTKVVFSEPILFNVADDDTARPILYYRLNGQLTRYRIAAHGASGADFQSGDAKPLHGGTDDYICKYTVPADATGEFVLAVDELNTDVDDNTLTAFYVHDTQLMLGEQIPPVPGISMPATSADTTPPRVVEVGFYHDSYLRRPITSDAVHAGDTIFTKVVFSKPMQLVPGSGAVARPSLFFVIEGVETPYRMKERGSFTSGECKPIRNSRDTYICRYTVRGEALGTFTLKVGEASVDTAGMALEAAYVHPGSLMLKPGVLSLSNTTLAENAGVDAVVGRLSTTGSGVRVYRLLDAEVSNLFFIDALGDLRAKVNFNYEARAAYTVAVEEVRTQARQSFEVQILDVNDPPTALRLTGTTFYKEDGVGTQIGKVRVSDEDSGDVHEIEVTKGGEFVGVRVGALEVLQLFDTQSKEIELQATDRGGLRYKAVFHITMQTRTTATPPSDPDPPSDSEPTQPTESTPPTQPPHPGLD